MVLRGTIHRKNKHVQRTEWHSPLLRCESYLSQRRLAPEHREWDALRLSLKGLLELLLLAPCSRGDGAIRRLVGDALERVRDARQFERELIGAARAPYYYDALTTEIQQAPKQQPDDRRHTGQQNVVRGDGDGST